jgi:hypothetical protein
MSSDEALSPPRSDDSPPTRVAKRAAQAQGSTQLTLDGSVFSMRAMAEHLKVLQAPTPPLEMLLASGEVSICCEEDSPPPEPVTEAELVRMWGPGGEAASFAPISPTQPMTQPVEEAAQPEQPVGSPDEVESGVLLPLTTFNFYLTTLPLDDTLSTLLLRSSPLRMRKSRRLSRRT